MLQAISKLNSTQKWPRCRAPPDSCILAKTGTGLRLAGLVLRRRGQARSSGRARLLGLLELRDAHGIARVGSVEPGGRARPGPFAKPERIAGSRHFWPPRWNQLQPEAAASTTSMPASANQLRQSRPHACLAFALSNCAACAARGAPLAAAPRDNSRQRQADAARDQSELRQRPLDRDRIGLDEQRLVQCRQTAHRSGPPPRHRRAARPPSSAPSPPAPRWRSPKSRHARPPHGFARGGVVARQHAKPGPHGGHELPDPVDRRHRLFDRDDARQFRQPRHRRRQQVDRRARRARCRASPARRGARPPPRNAGTGLPASAGCRRG